ncbi:MAG TPA: SDR family oxidoreductase [Chitinophagaceae bacterium]|nr:SDR family oxidoreductase [Chitinophagaceae bacterium]
MKEKILVTGSTGTIGKALVSTLKSKGASFVAGVTSEQRGKDILGADVRSVVLNYEKQDSYAKATEGVSKVFLLGPPLRTDMDTLVLPFIKHLKASGINRVVYISALGLDDVKELPFHNRVVQALKDHRFDYTILMPTFFAQNFKNYEWDNIVQRGITFVPAGHGKVGFVDVEDIALVAATVLTEEGHGGKTYAITGPELLSYQEAAEQLSDVIGKTIHYANPSPEVYTQALKDAGAPDFIASYMIPVYSMITDGKVAVLSDDVERLTGKKPTQLRVVLERDFAAVPQPA